VKLQKKTAKALAAYGKTLPTPIPYDYEYSAFETVAEFQAAGETLSLAKQMKAVNAARKAKARAATLTEVLKAAGHEKPNAENNEQVRLRETFKMLMTAKLPSGEKKYTEEQARVVASEVSGVAWEDDDDDDDNE